MPLRRPHRLLLAALAGALLIGTGAAAPALAGPANPPSTLPGLPGLPGLSETAAAALVPAVTDTVGGDPAGIWYEPGDGADAGSRSASPGGRLMVGTWDAGMAPVLSALGATPVLRDGPRRDPDAVHQALDERTATGMPAGLAAYGTDPRTEQVVLSVVEGPGAQELARTLSAGLDPAALRVETVPSAPLRQAAVAGGDTITDGTRRCTAGFAASDAEGAWLITAGHCTRQSSTWYAGSEESTIGSGPRSAAEGIDVGAIPVEEGTASPTVSGTPVAGSQAAPVGSSVCLYGSTSGRSCGTVERTGMTVNFDGQQQSGLTSVSACAREGDSGAPYLTSDGQAQGVHTGAGGADGCTSYFTPIGSATDALGLTLTTG